MRETWYIFSFKVYVLNTYLIKLKTIAFIDVMNLF